MDHAATPPPGDQDFRPHRGALILVLGVLSLVLFGIFTGLPACILGWNDLRAMNEGRMDPEGRGMTQVGAILGAVGSALTLLMVLGVLAVLVFSATPAMESTLSR